jgi:hypothetical protein
MFVTSAFPIPGICYFKTAESISEAKYSLAKSLKTIFDEYSRCRNRMRRPAFGRVISSKQNPLEVEETVHEKR